MNETILVIRPDFAKVLLNKGHTIVNLMPKRYKGSNNVDLTRCVFYFKDDETIKNDLAELINKNDN
jgi:hypothetical protein